MCTKEKLAGLSAPGVQGASAKELKASTPSLRTALVICFQLLLAMAATAVSSRAAMEAAGATVRARAPVIATGGAVAVRRR